MKLIFTVYFQFALLIIAGAQSSNTLSVAERIDAIKAIYKDSVELVIPMIENLLSDAQLKLDSAEIIQTIKYQGLANRKMGSYVNSIAAFKKVYTYARIKKDSVLQAEAADQIGIMNTFMGNMQEGQKYLIETSKIYDRVGTLKDKADSNNGLAIFYNDMNQTDKAIELYSLALSQYETISDTLGQANIHANLGILYVNTKSFKKAEYHILKQGHLDSLINTQWGLGFYHDFMGLLREKQGRLEEALSWYKSSLTIRENLSSHYNRAESRAGLSAVYLKLGRYDNAIREANLILLHKDLHESLSQQSNAYDLLSRAFEKKGNYNTSLQYHKEYMTMSDSIYQRDMLSEIADKDALYQKAKQNEKITRLNSKNAISKNKIANKNKVITLGAVALGIISLLLFFLYGLLKKVSMQKDQLAKSVKEKDLLLREIHHRVKNNLQLISSLLTLQSRSIDDEMAIRAINEGKSRVRSMALIHQDLYSRENRTSVSLKDYITKLTRELFYTYKIDDNKIELETYIDEIELDIDTVIPLGLIINELITNSLKYAFPNNQSGKLSIILKEKNNQLILIVKDNGIGFDPSQIKDSSFGSSLIMALTEQLGGHQKIESSNGTIITTTFEDYGNL